jgi:hypothetical protein
MQINEKELRNVITKMITEQFLKEDSVGMKNLLATRLLTIRAREAAFDFEKTIVKELKLMNPDDMDSLSQKVYVEAVEEMQKRVLSAVIDTVKSLAHLPQQQDEKEIGQDPGVHLNVT